jgi:UDP-glucose 4-epimerase
MISDLRNKTLMITGGTGSFGNKVLKYFLNTDISEIRVFSRDEKKQEDMRKEYNNSKLKFYIGDVRDFKRVSEVMNGVDFVFHAAALKQVPSCEFYPLEAVKTNILGTENVLNSAIQNKVITVVFLSTDKAVYPINAMGMSKALMEKLVIAKARTSSNIKTKFCITRYGNIMGSRGSVIPLFLSQIKNNDDLTITDLEMTRFLMSLEDSVELVLYAFNSACHGDIVVQKSPAATIGNLVSAIMYIFDYHNVKYIGTRHGEKQHEVLVSREEKIRAIEFENYFKIPMDNRTLDYNKYDSLGNREKIEEYTSFNAQQLSIDQIKDKLLTLDIVQQTLKELKNGR